MTFFVMYFFGSILLYYNRPSANVCWHILKIIVSKVPEGNHYFLLKLLLPSMCIKRAVTSFCVMLQRNKKESSFELKCNKYTAFISTYTSFSGYISRLNLTYFKNVFDLMMFFSFALYQCFNLSFYKRTSFQNTNCNIKTVRWIESINYK